MQRKLINLRLLPLMACRGTAMLLRGDFDTFAFRLRQYFLVPRGSGAMPVSEYREWIRRYDTLDDHQRQRIARRIQAMPKHPVISVVMPVYNPSAEWLRQAIDSVRNQLYPHWELCIADDASTRPDVRPLLRAAMEQDPRIKVVFRATNGHISAASNSALEIALGDYAALLDHDDLLPEHALYHVAETILLHPDAGIIYSDEDKVDEASQRSGPYFKSDWNYDLFLSHNMISHFGAYRTGLLREVGGFRTGFEGSQDYDLALRCIERLSPGQIIHIPRVLYHWRIIPGSTALAGGEKPYAVRAGERAINEHLSRIGVKAVATVNQAHYRVRYACPEPPPLVTLIIPTRNGLSLLRQCLDSIWKRTTYPNYEIIVVDNGSDEPECLEYLGWIQKERGVCVLEDDGPFNFSRLNNRAVTQAKGEIVVLLNNDTEVISPGWLDEMVSHAVRPGVGAVGARLWYPDGTLQHGGVILGMGGVAGHAHHRLGRHASGYFDRGRVIQSFSAVTAACLAIRKTIYLEIGGLNETDLAIAFNDVDFCLRVRAAGYRNVWTPYVELCHHESASRGQEDTPEKLARFNREILYMRKRWGQLLDQDPAYNPNLTLTSSDFSLAWPPRHADFDMAADNRPATPKS